MSRSKGKAKRKQLPLWQETILLLGVALVLAIVIKTFFVQAFYIPSESMEPGLILNDRILIQKVTYWGDDEPERGDVVVFKDPGGWLPPNESAGPSNPVAQVMAKIGLYPTGGHLVKRVIGIAGDTIVCCDKQGRLSVNGQPLARPGVPGRRDPRPRVGHRPHLHRPQGLLRRRRRAHLPAELADLRDDRGRHPR